MRTGLEKGEKLLVEVKRHWLVLANSFFLVLLSLIFLLAALMFPELFSWRDVAAVAVVSSSLFFLYRFYEREVDIWAVTNMRVIDEWGVFTRNARESPLDRINNVSYEQPLAGLLLGYGDVTIQTAAEHGDTTVKMVADPRGLKDAIVRAKSEFMGVRRDADNEVECPWCAERIKKRARICKHCGRSVERSGLSSADGEKSDMEVAR